MIGDEGQKPSSCWPWLSTVGQGNNLSPCRRMGSPVPALSTEYPSKTDLSECPERQASCKGEALRDTDLLISGQARVELRLAHRTPASPAGVRYAEDLFVKLGSSIQSPPCQYPPRPRRQSQGLV